MEGSGILPAVMPGKNAAICYDRLWKALVHEVMTEVNAMAHPLIRDATGKFLVETKFKVKLRIKQAVRLVHQPGAPVRILFANHLHFGTTAPARSMIVPFNFVLGDFAEDTGAHQIAHGNLVRFTAVLRANLNDELPCNDCITRRLDLFENIAHGFFAV